MYFSYLRKKNFKVDHYKEQDMEEKRTTPEFITELEPNEIFVLAAIWKVCMAVGRLISPIASLGLSWDKA